jgi:hypothetical protein
MNEIENEKDVIEKERGKKKKITSRSDEKIIKYECFLE